jgi:carbon storage regulator
MLVLSRKMGEQIVLPECGVTISVVKVAGKRVRLGIVAPPTAPIHRAEVWSRMAASHESKPEPAQGAEEAMPAAGPSSLPHPPPRAATTADAAESSSSLGGRLASCIAERTGGRIHSLRVEAANGRVIVHGRAASYYARQLALAAVSQALEVLGDDANKNVQLDIEVATG